MEEVDSNPSAQPTTVNPTNSQSSSPNQNTTANQNTATAPTTNHNTAANLYADNPLSPGSGMAACSTNGFVTPLKKRRLARESLSLESRPGSPDRMAAPLATQLSPPQFVPPPDEAANHAITTSAMALSTPPDQLIPATIHALTPKIRSTEGFDALVKIEPSEIPCTVNAFSSTTVILHVIILM